MRFSTETDRVEAFTDRVLAVILAIMVFELPAPQGTEPRALLPTLPAIATFALSFILIGIYWNNYHHMLCASRGVDDGPRVLVRFGWHGFSDDLWDEPHARRRMPSTKSNL